MAERYVVGNSEQAVAINNGAIRVRELLNALMSPETSVALIDLDGTNRPIINHVSRAFYFVLEGQGFFNIDGEDVYVSEGDYVLINPEVPYFDHGKMKLMAVCTPRFDPSKVDYLD